MARLFGVACLAVSADALRLEPMSRRAFAQSIAAAPLVGLTQAAFAERVSNAATDGVKAAPWMEAASSNVVLGVASREKPAFKEFDASLEGKLGFQGGKNVDESGAAYKSSSLTGSAGNAATLNGRKGGNLPTIRIAGKWADPGHPGCTRKVQLAGNKAFISGADEDGKPWKAVGVIEGDDVIIDFSAKGGPSDVKANFVLGKGLVFPDGNVWTKLS